MIVNCHNCGHKTEVTDRPARADSCESCLADLRVCKNCRHYDPVSWNECRETSAERVTDKEKANFCDYFSLNKETDSSSKTDGSPADQTSSRDKALADLDKLFKK